MDSINLIKQFLEIRSWKTGDIRAPHKPLLLLYALAKLSKGVQTLLYADIENDLVSLLNDFGPPRKTHHPNYPFWRLQKDNIWEISSNTLLQENSSGDVSKSSLINATATGKFNPQVLKSLQQQPTLISTLVFELLDANFPATIHEDILQSLGLDIDDSKNQTTKNKRCPKFREKILRAYEYRCAVCGFDIRLGHNPIALEAAHIKWHQAGGPEIEENGLALCVLHHKLFDRGAFTLSRKLEVLVSDRANGTTGFNQWLMQYHGMEISSPQNTNYVPKENYLTWHTKEVFHGEYRHL